MHFCLTKRPMNTRYSIIIADDADHEKVFAEIYSSDKFVACVSQEEGRGQLTVELPGPGLDETCILRHVPLTDLVWLLEEAAQKLLRGEPRDEGDREE